jgi:oxygen-independent coproporphyrinogen-3 oxidase
MHREVLKNANLLKKYNSGLLFDYTEYPTKGNWSAKYTSDDYKDDLRSWLGNGAKSVTLYVHTPYCEELCYFCLCSKSITKDYSKVSEYLYGSLFKEIELYKKLFKEAGKRPIIKEIYFGGGSPTYYSKDDFKALVDKMREMVDFSSVDTFTVEIDPRRVDVDKLNFYSEQGVNRLSFGVQDFDINVQKEINRIQPPELLENLLTPDIRKKFPTISFDILVGLPKQTTESMRATIDRVVQISPDEVQPLYVHYKPGTRSYMTRMTRNVLMPDFYDRKAIYAEVIDGLIEGGYVRAGYENFAKPNDRMAIAMQEDKATYNSIGTATGDAVDFMSIGASAHGVFANTYAQNYYEIDEYRKALDENRFPIYRGMKLSDDDLLRREVIKRLRIFFKLDFSYFRKNFNIDFEKYFASELEGMNEAISDGLIKLDSDGLLLTDLGKEFTPRICEIFDKYLDRTYFDESISNQSQISAQKVFPISIQKI